MKKINQISVIGDGSWGNTLAIYLSRRGYSVKLWGVFPDYLKLLNDKRENPKFLPGVKFPEKLTISGNIKEIITESELIVFAVPSKYMRSVLEKFGQEDFSDKIVLSVVKGIEEDTFLRMSELIQDVLADVRQVSVLSGPTIAYEVVCSQPTACIIASKDKEIRLLLQELFNSKIFRIYTSSDVIGVELCGAVKNIIAIAAGIAEGIGYGTNTKATLLTRSTVEFSRLGEELGAQSDTFKGLAGIGDLVTTCFSPRSRNRTFGEAIGKGGDKDDIISDMDMVVEGVTTVKAIYDLSVRLNIELPITKQVYEVLYNKKSPLNAVTDLMTRETKSESV